MDAVPPTQPVMPESKGGFFSKKILILVAVLVVLGGGTALGYFVFDIGREAPPSVEPAPSQDQAQNQAPTDSQATSPSTAENMPSATELFSYLPGADANVFYYIKPSDDTKAIVEGIKAGMSATSNPNSSTGILNEASSDQINFDELFGSMQEMAIAIKLDETSLKAFTDSSSDFNKISIAAVVRVNKDEEAKLIDRINKKPAAVKAVSKGNGIFVITNADPYTLSGKSQDNPLAQKIIAMRDNDLSMVIDFGSTLATTLDLTPIPDAPKALLKKVSTVSMAASLTKDPAGKFDFAAVTTFDLPDADTSTQFTTEAKKLAESALPIIPLQYQKFVTIDVVGDTTKVTVTFGVNDIETLVNELEKANQEAVKNDLEKMNAAPNPSDVAPTPTDGSTDSSTDSSTDPLSTLTPDGVPKIPRVKRAP